MQTWIGDLVQPLPRLTVHIGEIGEGAQRPEVGTEVADPGFNLPLFPGGARVAGARIKTVLAGEGQKARVETDEAAVVLGDYGEEIIVPTFAGHAAQGLKGVLMRAYEGLEGLAMGELRIEHAAVSFEQDEGVELALIPLIVEGAEVAPVDLEALAGSRFHAHEGAGWGRGHARAVHILPQDAVAARIAGRGEALEDDGAGGL